MLPTRDKTLSLEIERALPDALVVIAGEIDAANVGELYEQFAHLAREGIRRISLNLAELTFMDSTGLSLLVAIHKRTLSSGGELVIFSPTPFVRRLLVAAGLDSFFTIRPVTAPVCSGLSIGATPPPACHDQLPQAG